MVLQARSHTLDHYTGYTPIGTTYTQILEHLLSKCEIDLWPIRLEIENTLKCKNWDQNKYYKYHEE